MLTDRYGIDKVKVAEKPMLSIAEGAGILSHKLTDSFECPTCGAEIKSNQSTCQHCQNNVEKLTTSKIIDGGISYSTNHNYFMRLLDENSNYKLEKIIEKQVPLPVIVSKTFRTTSNNQKIVKVSLWTDVENNRNEEMTMGFFTIEDNLLIHSELVFNFEIDIDEIFNIRVYPKSNRSKEKQIILGRGNKDSKALKFLSECFDKVLTENYDQPKREYFFKTVQKEIEKINTIDINDKESEKWDEIGTSTFVAFENAEQFKNELDEDTLTMIFGQILCNQYHMLVPDDDLDNMRRYLRVIQKTDDPLERIRATQNLKEITDHYGVLISLFIVKIASINSEKINPSDSSRLITMHDTIVNHFRHGRSDEAFDLLDEALKLAERYKGGEVNITTVDLGPI
jgi:molecular chaperone DnaK